MDAFDMTFGQISLCAVPYITPEAAKNGIEIQFVFRYRRLT